MIESLDKSHLSNAHENSVSCVSSSFESIYGII